MEEEAGAPPPAWWATRHCVDAALLLIVRYRTTHAAISETGENGKDEQAAAVLSVIREPATAV